MNNSSLVTKEDVLGRLNELGNQDKVAFKKEKFAIKATNSIGVYHKDLKELAKEIGKNSDLGLELWLTNIYEARLLCSKIYSPKDLSESQAEEWVTTFENWEICDSFSMGVFAKSPIAIHLIQNWYQRDEEFVKRAAFATIAGYVLADKKAGNDQLKPYFDMIIDASSDPRNFVKKSVNWALRTLGKRNIDLKKEALIVSYKLLKSEHKSAQWIAKDAIKELEKPTVKMQDHPRSIYRP